jgi:hypothetical protein
MNNIDHIIDVIQSCSSIDQLNVTIMWGYSVLRREQLPILVEKAHRDRIIFNYYRMFDKLSLNFEQINQ